MNLLRNNAFSIVTARAVMGALGEKETLLPQRRAGLIRTRNALYGWLREHNLPFIESQANFLLIDVGRPAREFGVAMSRAGVAPGRPFPPLDNMLRVTIGTDAEMERFREVFWKVYQNA
jgi:histidinol-phosphate/aromatic aminotransferase/cobyric acid decarboxylase-like protein